jgi:chromosomal replication initiator protein
MFGITLEQIDSSTRKKQIALARQIAMYLSRKFGNFSFPKIAAAFHKNDHTTVMHAVTKIEELRNESEEINHIILELEKRLNLLVGEVKIED